MIQVLINALVSASIYFLVGVGFSIIYTSAKVFHFAHAAVIAVGAYTTYFLREYLGLYLPVAFAGGILASAVAGVAVEISVYRPLRRRGGGSVTSLLASIGLSVTIQALLTIAFGSGTRSFRGGVVSQGWSVGGASLLPLHVLTILVGPIVFIALWLMSYKTRTGVRLRALASDTELAHIYGINQERLLSFAFLIGSILAGVAAILIAWDTDATPTIGFNTLLMGLSAVIIGGLGSLRGAAAGALFLGVLHHFGAWWVSSRWQYAITFVVLVLFLAFRPHGFFGIPLRKTTV